MAGLLHDSGYEVVESNDLSDWVPHKDGSCVVLGVDGPEDIEGMRAFREEHPHTPVVAVSAESGLSTFARLIRVGAVAVVTESESAEDVWHAIADALGGHVFVTIELVQGMAGLVPDTDEVGRWLSDEEVGWLRAMAAGATVLELADDVGYSERAMFRRLKEMYKRIDVDNRTEALLWASQRGVLASEG